MWALLIAAGLLGQSDMAVSASNMIDGRPSPRDRSPLQAIVDATPSDGTVVVQPGRYVGDLIIDRPLRIVGVGRPLLVGSTAGSVVRIRAADVSIEGVDIDGGGGGDLGRDSSGIHVAAPRASIRNCRIANTLFGVYLREADDATVSGCSIRGIPGKDAGEKGSGIHIWNTNRFHIVGNEITDVRDGLYIQSSSHGTVTGNTARDLRYGLHYMFSDDNTFEDNRFENGAAGTALMNSRRITFRRNRFLHNRGFASVGLLLKACDDVVAEDNLVADNARGIFIEGSYRNRFSRNIIAESDVAIILYDSAAQTVFEGNSFVGNLTPLSLVGRRTDTRFDGNYWSDHGEPDLDGDGRSDRPYRLSSVFDHMRSNLTAADLFTQGLAAAAVGAAERAFPVLDPIPVVDHRPLAHPPSLALVPNGSTEHRRANRSGLAVSFLLFALGAGALVRNRSPRRQVHHDCLHRVH